MSSILRPTAPREYEVESYRLAFVSAVSICVIHAWHGGEW